MRYHCGGRVLLFLKKNPSPARRSWRNHPSPFLLRTALSRHVSFCKVFHGLSFPLPNRFFRRVHRIIPLEPSPASKCAALGVIGQNRAHDSPKPGRMVHFDQMRKLMHDHIFDKPGRHPHQSPRKTDASLRRAAAPPLLGRCNAHGRRPHTHQGGIFVDKRRQNALCLRNTGLFFLLRRLRQAVFFIFRMLLPVFFDQGRFLAQKRLDLIAPQPHRRAHH